MSRPGAAASNPVISPVKFGAAPAYQGPYNHVWTLTDFQDQTSNARVYQRFLDVQQFTAYHRPAGRFPLVRPLHRLRQILHYIQRYRDNDATGLFGPLRETGRLLKQYRQESRSLKAFDWARPTAWHAKQASYLPHTDIADIPLRNIDYASQSLFELAREPNRDVFIHVTDPGVGSGQDAHKRSILVTRNHGVHVGPNNGTLGLLVQFLEKRQQPYQLLEIDLEKIHQLEVIRTRGQAESGSTFHGRDVFAVAAGAIAGGLKPESLATKASVEKTIEPVISRYGELEELPRRRAEAVTVRANRDNTSGNLVLNVALSPAEFRKLLKESPRFKLIGDNQALELPLKQTFGQVDAGEALMYLGSKKAPDPTKKYLEVAVNCGNAAQRLGLPAIEEAVSLTLQRD